MQAHCGDQTTVMLCSSVSKALTLVTLMQAMLCSNVAYNGLRLSEQAVCSTHHEPHFCLCCTAGGVDFVIGELLVASAGQVRRRVDKSCLKASMIMHVTTVLGSR